MLASHHLLKYFKFVSFIVIHLHIGTCIYYSCLCNIVRVTKIMVTNNILKILKSGDNSYHYTSTHPFSKCVFYFLPIRKGGKACFSCLFIIAASLISFCIFTVNCSNDKGLGLEVALNIALFDKRSYATRAFLFGDFAIDWNICYIVLYFCQKIMSDVCFNFFCTISLSFLLDLHACSLVPRSSLCLLITSFLSLKFSHICFFHLFELKYQ